MEIIFIIILILVISISIWEYVAGKVLDIIFTGDLIFNRVNPVLKGESGVKVSQWIRVLDLIINHWGESIIVPGQGAVGDKKVAVAMRQYILDMTVAALDPGKENQLKENYKEWMKLPNMSSPELTIEYIKMSELKKLIKPFITFV
jgi:glyoxylase-like metal-dependent hydrolase (beta-lactamase superfamily II)